MLEMKANWQTNTTELKVEDSNASKLVFELFMCIAAVDEAFSKLGQQMIFRAAIRDLLMDFLENEDKEVIDLEIDLDPIKKAMQWERGG